MIGRGGETVQEIERKTQTKINFKDERKNQKISDNIIVANYIILIFLQSRQPLIACLLSEDNTMRFALPKYSLSKSS